MPRLTADALRPHQREIMQTALRSVRESRPLLIHGARGTLKTTTLVLTLWMQLRALAAYYRDMRIVVAMSDHSALRDTFLAAWAEQVHPSEYVYHGTDHTLTLTPFGRKQPNPAIIQLKHAGDFKEGASANRAARYKRGASIHGYYFPQAESVSKTFYTEIDFHARAEPTPRIRDMSRVPYSLRWFDANPDSPNHWLHSMFLDPKAPAYNASALVRSYPMTPETSIYPPEKIAEFRSTLAPHDVARMVDGKWVGAEGAMFKIDDSRHIANDVPTSPRWYLAIDWGFEPGGQAVLLIAQGDDRFHVADERHYIGKQQEDIIPDIHAMLNKNGVVTLSGFAADTADHDGNIYRYEREFRCYSMTVFKDRGKGWRLVARRFVTFDSLKRPRITIAPHCLDTQRSLRGNEWNPAGTDSKPNTFDHHADALRYYTMSDAVPDRDE